MTTSLQEAIDRQVPEAARGCPNCRNGIKAAPWETLHRCGTLYETLMFGVAGELIVLCDCETGNLMRKCLLARWNADRKSMYGQLLTKNGSNAFEIRKKMYLDRLAEAPPELYRK